MKRTINRLFGAALLLAALVCFVFCASAQDAKSGSCGEALQWTLEDGTLTISGTGEMADYSRNQAPWVPETVTRVIVEEGVTSISENAFRINFSLEQVTLPASLRSIGKTAFWQCASLQKAELAEGLQTIGAQAFKGCKALQEITLPQSLESIGDEAFSGCEALPLLSLGPKMKTVPAGAFSDCKALRTATLDDAITAVGDNAFFRCAALQQIALPQSLQTIGRNAFAETGLSAVSLPPAVTELGDAAFSGCNALEAVTFPDGLTTIGSGAFMNCAALKEAQIPNSVTTLGGSAFSSCAALTKVTLPNMLTAVPENCFSGCALLKDAALPDGLTAIGTGSFSACAALESLQIPATVTAIGAAAFRGCVSLETIELPAAVSAVEAESFSGCSKLQKATLPQQATQIGDKAFASCGLLKDVVFPLQLKTIGKEAFLRCYELKVLALPQGLTAIGKDAFEGTGCLEDPENRIDGCVYAGSYLLQGDPGRTTYAVREGTTLIADDALVLTDKLETITLPETLTSFGNADFSACTALQKVNYGGTEAQWHALTAGGRKPLEPLAAAEVHCKAADGSTLVLSAVPMPETESTCTVCGTYGGKQCSNCGAVVVQPKEKGIAAHNWEEKENRGATCVKKGTVVFVCTVCGETSTVQRLMPGVHMNTGTVPATEPTCKSFGYTEGVYCYDCHKYLSGHQQLPMGHRYTETLKPATMEKNGKIVRTCVYCRMKSSTLIYRVQKISLSGTRFVYDGKSHKPSVTITDTKGNKLVKNVDYRLNYSSGRKAVGIYTVTVTFQGNYAGEKTLSFKIVPPAVKNLKVTAGKNSAKLTWAKNKQTDLYIIYRAAAKDGKYKKLGTAKEPAYTAEKLTGGKVYYFKVVAVRKLDSGNLYSADSAIKKVRVK